MTDKDLEAVVRELCQPRTEYRFAVRLLDLLSRETLRFGEKLVIVRRAIEWWRLYGGK